MSRPTRGSHDALPVRACHPLWSAVPDASGSRRTTTGLVPVRSPLLRESRLMSFPPGTEMVQFPGFASPTYEFSRRYRSRGGLPHSEIRGSTGARPSPRLIAACHVLHRLSAPRHPPDALLSLAPPQPTRRTAARTPGRPSIPVPRIGTQTGPKPRPLPTRPAASATGPPTLFTMSKPPPATRRTRAHADTAGGPGPNRTADLTLIRGAL